MASEVKSISSEGLRLLDEHLVSQRIKDAAAQDALSEGALRRAQSGNVFAIDDAQGRAGRICFVIGRSIFDDDPGGCEALLRYWGGEAIRGGPDDGPEFATIGTPSIVVAGLNLTTPHNKPYSWPTLSKVFVGNQLGLAQRYAEVHYQCPVPAGDIHAVWQPGNENYDRHVELPH